MILSQKEVAKLLEKYKIPTPELTVVKSVNEIDDSVDYPVVMKIHSPDIIHKSDVGGVIMNVHSPEEGRKAFKKFESICKKKNAKFDGAMVQPQQDGNYVIIGLKKDPQFGHVIMFGSGGIFVEVMKDVTFRVCPVSKKDALEMIHEIKGYPILAGARGKPADLNKIADVIKKVSVLGMKEDVKEMDINPLIVWDKGVSAVDVRIEK